MLSFWISWRSLSPRAIVKWRWSHYCFNVLLIARNDETSVRWIRKELSCRELILFPTQCVRSIHTESGWKNLLLFCTRVNGHHSRVEQTWFFSELREYKQSHHILAWCRIQSKMEKNWCVWHVVSSNIVLIPGLVYVAVGIMSLYT
jgi:hypothetical protein